MSEQQGPSAPCHCACWLAVRVCLAAAANRMCWALPYRVPQRVHEDKDVAAMHAAAEIFDAETEVVYQYLQVFSACAVSFGHGANDVANAVGPFAGIW